MHRRSWTCAGCKQSFRQLKQPHPDGASVAWLLAYEAHVQTCPLGRVKWDAMFVRELSPEPDKRSATRPPELRAPKPREPVDWALWGARWNKFWFGSASGTAESFRDYRRRNNHFKTMLFVLLFIGYVIYQLGNRLLNSLF